jgi:acetyl esterase/lipase
MTGYRFRLAAGFVAAIVLMGLLAACSPLSLVNAVSPARGAQASVGIPYAPGERHGLDVYTPPGRSAGQGGAAPVIVFFYGGNWVSGRRDDYAFVGRALAARGFVVVIPDYRLYPQVRYPDFLVDAAKAVAWTERSIAGYGGDPHRVYLMGHSAGAYNAAMLALDGRWLGREGVNTASIRGWIGLAGPYDFLPIENRTTRPVFDYPDTPPDSQPASHVAAGAPPALLIAPRHDQTVDPVRNTGGLAARLRAAGVPVTERYYDGVSHATLVASLSASLRRLAPTLDAVSGFIQGDAAGARVSDGGNGRRTADRGR